MKQFFNYSVDSIMYDINKKIEQLQKLRDNKRKEAHQAEETAMTAHAEANKAERVYEKLQSIMN